MYTYALIICAQCQKQGLTISKVYHSRVEVTLPISISSAIFESRLSLDSQMSLASAAAKRVAPLRERCVLSETPFLYAPVYSPGSVHKRAFLSLPRLMRDRYQGLAVPRSSVGMPSFSPRASAALRYSGKEIEKSPLRHNFALIQG